MSKREIKLFKEGDKVAFYVKRFHKWYEGIIVGKDDSLSDETGNPCYNVRVTKAEPNKWGFNEIGNLWGVESTLMKEVK